MKITVQDSKRHLRVATRILRRILARNKALERKIRKEIDNLDYPLSTKKGMRNSKLVAFYGKYDHGIVLLVSNKGLLQFAVAFSPIPGKPTLWEGTYRLPQKFAKILSGLNEEDAVQKYLLFGLR